MQDRKVTSSDNLDDTLKALPLWQVRIHRDELLKMLKMNNVCEQHFISKDNFTYQIQISNEVSHTVYSLYCIYLSMCRKSTL